MQRNQYQKRKVSSGSLSSTRHVHVSERASLSVIGQHHFTDENVNRQLAVAEEASEARKKANGKGKAPEDTTRPVQQRSELQGFLCEYSQALQGKPRIDCGNCMR